MSKNHRLLYLITLMLISSSETFAQSRYLDSLKTELQNAIHDSTRVKIYIALADSVEQKNLIFYGEQVLQLSSKLLQNTKGEQEKKYLLKEKSTGFSILASFYSGGDHADLNKVNLYGEKAGEIFEELKDTELIVYNYISLNQINLSQGNFPKALEYLQLCLAKSKAMNFKQGIAFSYSGIADMYRNQGEHTQALENYENALAALKDTKDTTTLRNVLAAMGGFYYKNQNLKKSLEYYNRVIDLYVAQNMSENICYVYGWMGDAYKDNGDLTNAIMYFKKSVPLFEKINQKGKVKDMLNRIGKVYYEQNKLDSALYYHQQALKKSEEMKNDLGIAFSCLQLSYDYHKQRNYQAAEQFCNRTIVILKKQFDINTMAEAELHASQIDSALGNGIGAYNHFKQYTLLKEKLNAEEVHKQAQREKYQSDYDRQKAKTAAEQEKKDIRQRSIRNSISAGLAGALIFLVVVYRQRNKISKARKRSEELLLNILPGEVAEELKEKGVAEAKHFDQVTVMFTDFKGFTQISEKLTPKELVAEIDTCFKAFDNIITKHGIEKIKTIGDAYMCAGGLPVANKTHASDVVAAALEIQQLMQAPPNLPEGEEYDLATQVSPSGRFRGAVRIGIHTGPVVAGIVGIKKFAYDIWGDTVNIASRMESSGEAGKVNISGSTYELVKDQFNCTHRGKIQAKNKGEIDMYFVNFNYSEG